MIGLNDEYEEYLIPLPRMSVTAILADAIEVTPEMSEKLGAYLGVSDMLFYDIQQALKERAGVRELTYA